MKDEASIFHLSFHIFHLSSPEFITWTNDKWRTAAAERLESGLVRLGLQGISALLNGAES
jgi:hypothetical protein